MCISKMRHATWLTWTYCAKNLVVCLVLATATVAEERDAVAPKGALASRRRVEQDFSKWTIYITNDNCPDYTWGFTEEQTRQAFADIVKAHLDQMNQTDNLEPAPPGQSQAPPRRRPANRDCYNMAVTQEALCFLEQYPERKDELIRRIKEGRIYVSPFLCNSLWAFQSTEGVIRTLYPARRLAQDWGISIDVAEHIELPSLPWGVSSILSGCGIRWLSIAYLDYDSTFAGLKNPPLFILEGPDGCKIHVILDQWASSKANYTQGAHIVRNPDSILKEWLPHYAGLGEKYPLRVILASGTHGDISPASGDQTKGFAEAIASYNAQPGQRPRLVNATLPQFCRAVNEVQGQDPFLETVRGCFGHSWDLWPVSLAKYAADMREAERVFLTAEALLAVATTNRPEPHKSIRPEHRQAEWYWTMLADHAWNGNSDQNRLHNADLRKKWSRELSRLGNRLLEQGWAALGLEPSREHITVFNGLSFPRRGPVRIAIPEDVNAVMRDGKNLDCQVLTEDNQRFLYFVCPETAGFGFRQIELATGSKGDSPHIKLVAEPAQLESPYYRLKVDLQTGGISSLIHKATGSELATPGSRTIAQQCISTAKSTH